MSEIDNLYTAVLGLKAPWRVERVETQLDAGAEARDTLGTIVLALRSLGLELKSGKGKGEVLVVDHLEKPSEN